MPKSRNRKGHSQKSSFRTQQIKNKTAKQRKDLEEMFKKAQEEMQNKQTAQGTETLAPGEVVADIDPTNITAENLEITV
jgi:hypothetical protein